MIREMDNEQTLMKTEVLKQNLQKISFLNKVFTIVIVSLFILTNVLSNIPILNLDNLLSFTLMHFVVFILFNLIIYYLIDIRKLHVKDENINKMEFFVSVYVTLFITIGALVSTRELDIYNPLLIYTLILLSCSSFLILTAKQVAISLAISSPILLSGLYMQHGMNDIFKLQIIYILSVIPIAFFISQSIYYSFKRSIKYQVEMMKEAQVTRNLTKKLREANRKLELQASLDPLTNLHNRRAYNEYLKGLQIKAKESPFYVSVIMIDVDCFKLYNDTYGHTEGDNVLVKIGEILNDLADEYNCLASRWGGEEFSLLLADKEEVVTKEICNKVKMRIEQLNIPHCQSMIADYVTVSMGACTTYITEPSEIYTCIKKADEALYNVKENGRNSFEHCYVEGGVSV
ncbi:GGDEF domain-containing protein [Lysinibacillus sp. BW-2-10]|uniref:GGDEF domain-containing protein n=1 Tax=Lysinibacillus sp. BW-2-10 TaxID=2590030 RepID=UPI00117CE950|nr:GGDEF domain-containing protein [Lysinibacillus sp. BW-2-10]TSI02519.1 GGDEF domain-containing protein [Lysinibacillus sp. BW-2-10]